MIQEKLENGELCIENGEMAVTNSELLSAWDNDSIADIKGDFLNACEVKGKDKTDALVLVLKKGLDEIRRNLWNDSQGGST